MQSNPISDGRSLIVGGPEPRRTQTGHVLLAIVNAHAGSGAAADKRGQLAELVAAHGQRLLQLKLHDAHAKKALKDATAENARVILAGGGDGTLSAVAHMLVGTQTALGVLPLGTLNHFSKDLGIPQDLPGALAVALSGQMTAVDLGEVNGQTFLNNSSIGLYPGLVEERDSYERHGVTKWLAFVRALAISFYRYRKMTVTLCIDGEERTIETPFVFVGNNRYNLCYPKVGSRESITENKLWVCAAPRASRLKLAWWMICAIFGGGSVTDPMVVETKSISIRSRAPSLHVANDGEVALMATPLHYPIKAGALHVMVPVNGGGTQQHRV